MDKKEAIKNTLTRIPKFGLFLVVFQILLAGGVYLFAQSQLHSPNNGYNPDIWNNVILFAIALAVFSVIMLIYFVVIWGLETNPKYQIHEKLVIESKSLGVRWKTEALFEFTKRYFITPKDWFFGLKVSKEVYNAINPGDTVDITYYKFSKNIKEIKIL